MNYRHDRWAGQRRMSMMRGAADGLLVKLRWLVLVLMYGSASSGVRAAPPEIVVPRDHPTIQAAVDAALPGDTIRVRPGTYTEEVVIAKDLTLEGAAPGATLIKAPDTLTPYATDLRFDIPVVSIVRITDDARVTLSGFTIEGPIPCDVIATGIRVMRGATLELLHSHITRLRAEQVCFTITAGQGIAIGVPVFQDDGQPGSVAHATITRVRVDRYRNTGIIVVGPPGEERSTATISHNVIAGGDVVPGTIANQAGIMLAFEAEALVTGNSILGNVCSAPAGCGRDPINEAQSIGILANQLSLGTEISENRISDNDVGIHQQFSPDCCTISENRLQDNRFFGIVIHNGDGTTFENTIKGGEVGIGVVADTVDTVGVLQGDRIKQTSVAPVQEIECCGVTATAIVQ